MPDLVLVNTLAYGVAMAQKTKLQSLDWIKAGFRALVAKGPQALKVEPIARELKVSKGSFYWHFKDLDDLKAKMLVHWQEMATAAIIAEVRGNVTDKAKPLHRLLEVITEINLADYGGEQAEAAIRDWARYDGRAAKVLARVDGQRLQFLEQLFAQQGGDPTRCKTKAKLLYAGLIGLQGLNIAGGTELRENLLYLLEKLLQPDGG